jgi:hypothetical protein
MNKIKSSCFIMLIILSACTNKKSNPAETAIPYRPVSKELYDTIARMDSLLFAAFNDHDIDRQKDFFSDSLEFFHDKGGLSNYEQTIQNSKRLFEQNKTTGLRRDLVPGSLEVYPINKYGAVQTGLHTFCHKENRKDDCGTFKFLHIWQHKNGEWKITRVVSYDH